MTDRSDAQLDALLRQALSASPEAPAEAEPLDDAVLADWQAGRLDADDAREVEGRLAADPEARAVAWGRVAFPVDDLQVQRAARLGPPRRVTAGYWVAAAAAVLVAVGGWWRVSTPPTPDYLAGELQGVAQALRGPTPTANPARAPVYPDSTLVLPLRPRTAQDTAPPAQVWVTAAADERLRAVPFRAEAADKGGLRLVIELGPAALTPGEWTLHVVLGEASAAAGEALGQARARAGAWWHSQPLDVRALPEQEAPR